MKYIIFTMILAVLKESHPLNPEIVKFEQYMKEFETTGQRIKQEVKDQKTDTLVMMMKRESMADKNVENGTEGVSNNPGEGIDNDVCTVKEEIILKPGQHYLNSSSCEIWYCRKRLIRYAEIDEYTCKEIAEFPDVYEVFYEDCVAKKCVEKKPLNVD